MQPTTPGQTLQPAASQTSPQGVQAPAPVSAPSAPQLPASPNPGAAPAPLQNPSYNPTAALGTIADYYQIPRDTALNMANQQQQAAGAGQRFEASKFQAGVQQQNLQDQLNPSKYTVNNDPSSEYGISITNSLGQKVDLGTYVNLTGQNPAQVLAKSTDPAAQEFVGAYNNLEDLMQTMIGASAGDQTAKAKLGDYYEANPGLQNMTPSQVTGLFMQRYGQFFGAPQQQAPQNTGVSPTFQSANNPVTTSPYYNQNFQTEFQNNPYQQGGVGDLSSMLQQLQQQQSGG